MPRPILVSACLLGLRTRYNDKTKLCQKVLDYLAANDFTPIPVCPEQLAGLPTPRPQTCFARGDGNAVLDGSGSVANDEGVDVTEAFIRGARQTAAIAKLCACKTALLKERSPSCGVTQVYLGDAVIEGRGVTAALLARNDIEVFSEDALP